MSEPLPPYSDDSDNESYIDVITELPFEDIATPVHIHYANDQDDDTEDSDEDENTEDSEEDESDEESEEDEDREMTEEEKKEEEKWKQRERDFFAFKLEPEPADDRPLVGKELLRELALHKKMRKQVLEQIKPLRKVPYIKNMLHALFRNPAAAGMARSELDVQGAFMPHPYPL